MGYMSNWISTKIHKSHLKSINQLVGRDAPYRSLAQLVDFAIRDLLKSHKGGKN